MLEITLSSLLLRKKDRYIPCQLQQLLGENDHLFLFRLFLSKQKQFIVDSVLTFK